MSMQDPIADMLTRIRNAGKARLQKVVMPSSKMKAAIAEVLKKEGYITDYSVAGDVKKELTVDMKYYQNQPVIEGIERVSKTSCRIYCGSEEIPRVRNGLGMVVLSTPKGVVSCRTAKAEHVGGEVLCYVW